MTGLLEMHPFVIIKAKNMPRGCYGTTSIRRQYQQYFEKNILQRVDCLHRFPTELRIRDPNIFMSALIICQIWQSPALNTGLLNACD